MLRKDAFSRLRVAITVAKQAWMILGLALLLLVALELGYRALNYVIQRIPGQTAAAPEDRPDHPYAGKDWFRQFSDASEMGRREYRYDPYRSWWLTAKTSKFVNISAAGTRLTLPQASSMKPAHRIFMLGGSTMWGITARDAYTIPSLTAARLKDRGMDNVEVVNFGHAGFNSTQEAITLMLELARGNVPTIAVFLNGYNDIFLGLLHGEPGHAWDEVRTQQLLDLGRGGLRALLTASSDRLQTVKALNRLIAPAKDVVRSESHGSETCVSIASYYGKIARATKAMGAEYGFATLYLQQPHHASSRKVLTGWERQFHRNPQVRHCAEAIDRAMSEDIGRSYLPLYSMFDEYKETVFVDDIAHLTEDANGAVADAIVKLVIPLLERKLTDN